MATKQGLLYIKLLENGTEGKTLLETENMPLEDWLALLKKKPKDKIFIDYMFPTDSHRNEYLETVSKRDYREIKSLLRNFLWLPGSFPADGLHLENIYNRLKNSDQSITLSELDRRIILWGKSKGKITVWDGTQWVIDLLPNSPKECLQVLWAYFSCYAAAFPEGRMHGLIDAMDVIRNRFILTPYSIDLYRNISDRILECLVAALYKKMEYRVKLTPQKRDGGRDVIAISDQTGRSEYILIEVKHHKKPIGVKIVRELLGIVSDEKANRGVVVCTSKFTRDANELSRSNPRIELIDGQKLIQLLNENFGSNWNSNIFQIVAEVHNTDDDSSIEIDNVTKTNRF